ncbi:MAG: histidine phosphatase family protein [Micropruina sp.]|uniref:SixA phosphatase family protein n=1 Tax=Micropruina sp. TaxID=2737536 RepID=UPI0039E33939
MRTLHLLRHAEAAWQTHGPGGDHARLLSARGVQQARGVGADLRDAGIELILASSATRTMQTAEALGLGVPVRSCDTIYNAGPSNILEELMTLRDGCFNVLVVGHAPGIPALVHSLADHFSNADARALIAYRYPPATLSTLTVHTSWAKLKTATLVSARIAPEPG